VRILFTILALCAVLVFTGLGIWQIERHTWKLNLIAQTAQNLHSLPITAPPPPTFIQSFQAYTPVTATGHFLHQFETPVLAVTQYGRGYWLLTPFQTDGFIVMVNRGWIPTDMLDPAKRPQSQPQGQITVTGLLRLTEPKGAFLRHNNPVKNQWFSRDIKAIATQHNLSNTAITYFIDAGPTPANTLPVGGLTVIHFRNSHLVYALTWFGLALMSALAALYLAFPHRFQRTETRPNSKK
jgi:surfeit locus 1 family protein